MKLTSKGVTCNKYWKKKLFVHKFVCFCAYTINNIKVISVGLGGTIFGRGKNVIINYIAYWM